MPSGPRAHAVSGIALGAGLALGLLGPATAALAGPSPQRTVRVRVAAAGEPNGPSSEPALSADGRRVAFTSLASNLTGAPAGGGDTRRGVFVYDQGTGAVHLASAGRGGEPADGSSREPVLDADGTHLAFTSRATNLVAGDGNGSSDVFVLAPDTGLARASVAANGEEADGASSEPDLSADGRTLVFTSSADNLVPGDTNEHDDVFVRDMVSGQIALLSGGRHGAPSDGDSSAPAISPDGRFVSFSSKATNLVAGDRNDVADVFMVDLALGETKLISVARGGGGQNAARSGGRAMVSDVSRDGRFVVFESDATNLAGRDRNRRTDIFVRDNEHGSTRRVSLSTTNEEAGGASYLPTITPDGRYVAFGSRANDLVAEDAQGPDVFVRELAHETTVLVDVTARGRLRGREAAVPPPGRPSLSADGATAAFVSSAANLAGADHNRAADVFLRRLAPPASATAERRVGLVGGRLLIVFRSSDRAPSPLQCRLDGGPPTLCPLNGLLLPKLGRGAHVLRAYAGALGAHYAGRPIVIRMNFGKGRPRVRVENPADL